MSDTRSTEDHIIKEIWQRFIHHQETPEDIRKLDPIVYESWKRSRGYGVDPYEPKSLKLDPESIKKRLSDNKLLISIASSYLQKLSSFLEGERFTVILTDADGIILDVSEGTGEAMEQKKKQTHIDIGAIRTESVIGTAGSSTCLIIDQPIMFKGAEHYIEPHQAFSGSSAPIHFNGKIIGSISLLGPLQNHYRHTLGMMVAAADGIEKEFRLRSAYYKLQLTNSQLESTFQSISSGIIMIDNNGRILHTNEKICRLLSLANKELIGRKLQEIVSIDPLEQPLHLIDENFYSREITLTLDRGRSQQLLMTACTILNPKGVRHGVVLTFDTPKQVNRLVSRLSGFTARYTFDSIIGDSPQTQNVKYLASMAARADSSVLILGESGTGKELFAQAIHNASDRAKYPFIAINCASLPAELVESELFGYVGGAFTGASKEGQPGKFELANNGTLFLDEIGDMPFGIQASLLRVLQMKETIRIGGKKPIPVNVRIIAATNKNLEREISASTFRQDLYYRLNVFPIRLPALRDRKEDIKALLDHFLRAYSGKGLSEESISYEATALLEQYEWPGNIREMQNVVERASILAQGSRITAALLPPEIAARTPAQTARPEYGFSAGRISGAVSAYQVKEHTRDLDKEMITAMLRDTNGNVVLAARLLGISRQTLYNKIRQYQITVSDFRFQK